MQTEAQFLNARAGQFLRSYENARYSVSDLHPVIQPAITLPEGSEEIADVSFYQGDINWDIYRQNARAAVPRISQGNWIDTKWERNYSEGKRVGCLLGGYHFVDDRYHPDEQTQTILNAMNGKNSDMEIWLDWETSYGGPYRGLPNVLKIHRNLVSAGVKCYDVGVYSGYYYVVEHSDPVTNAADYEYIRVEDVPFWIAWYASPAVVKVPPPWTTWTLWQSGTPVRNWGQATAEIDIDRPNATPDQITLKYGGNTPPNGGDMEITHNGVLVISGLASRTGPGTSYPAVNPPGGSLQKGDQIFGQWDNPGTQWFHYTKIQRVNGLEEAFEAWCSAVRGDEQTPPYVKVSVVTQPVKTMTINAMLNPDGTIAGGTWELT